MENPGGLPNQPLPSVNPALSPPQLPAVAETLPNPVDAEHLLPPPHFHKKLLIFIPILLILLPLLTILFLYIVEPFSQPERVYITNVSDHQATISWVTNKATKGEVLLSSASTSYKDDGEKKLKTTDFYTTHYVTLPDLEPETKYQFQIYQGMKKAYQGEFVTGPTLSSLSTPDPVYGKVVLANGKVPITGALVYLTVKNKDNLAATLSTLTNKAGGWSIDLANLRTINLKNRFPVATNSSELLIVEAPGLTQQKLTSKPSQDKPWPDIVLREEARQ